jgi:hypothetical protein
MKKKVFFVYGYKFNYKYELEHNFNYLEKKIKLNIIDLSKIFTPKYKKNITRYNKKNLHVFSKLSNYIDALKNYEPDYVVLEGAEDFKKKINLITRRHLKRTRIIEFFNSPVPDELNNYKIYVIIKTILNIKIRFFYKIFFSLIKLALNKFKKNIRNQKNYYTDIIFYAGNKAFEDFKFKDFKKKVSSPSFDYQISLQQKQRKNKVLKKKYAVFIDSMILHHDDKKFNYKEKEHLIGKKYFHDMNNFFELIEKKFKLEIIIALHPTCFIKKYSKFFNNRKCFKYKTAELIKKSSYVFSHASSTAVNFAIIYNKPLIYLTTNEMEKSFLKYKRHLIKKKIFKYNFFNISDIKEKSIPNSFKIDKLAFRKYYKNYINSCKYKNVSLSEVFLRNLK